MNFKLFIVQLKNKNKVKSKIKLQTLINYKLQKSPLGD
jgi:hypothetical protein